MRVGGFADVGIVGTNNLKTVDFSAGLLVVHRLAEVQPQPGSGSRIPAATSSARRRSASATAASFADRAAASR